MASTGGAGGRGSAGGRRPRGAGGVRPSRTAGNNARRISAAEFTRATGTTPRRSSTTVSNLNAGGRRNTAEQERLNRNRRRGR